MPSGFGGFVVRDKLVAAHAGLRTPAEPEIGRREMGSAFQESGPMWMDKEGTEEPKWGGWMAR